MCVCVGVVCVCVCVCVDLNQSIGFLGMEMYTSYYILLLRSQLIFTVMVTKYVNYHPYTHNERRVEETLIADYLKAT